MPNQPSKIRDHIIIRGARVNNLKNIDVDIPRDKLVVVTGLSGSGKSSLAFDVVYAEGNRRYLEGMSSYARQFLDVSAKPDVDKIENLSPTISIDQRSVSRSPRSTVGTLTEIYDYLRVLFAKIGTPYCPDCQEQMVSRTNKEMLDEILTLSNNTQLSIMAKIRDKNKSTKELLRQISQSGYARVRFNGKIMLTAEAIMIANDSMTNDVYVVVDRVTLKTDDPDKERILDSIATALKIGHGIFQVLIDNEEERTYNKDFVCHRCYYKIREVSPKNFSFNSPEGACSYCSGLGVTKEVEEDLIIPNRNLSLAEGAIMPLAKSVGRINRQGSSGMNMLEAVAEEYGFSLDEPVRKISREVMKIILYGAGEKEITVSQRDAMGGIRKVKTRFEGVIPILKKKYLEAGSDYLRSEIDKYMIEKTCPVCEGKRLKKESLAILIDGKSIDDVVNLDLEKFKKFLNGVQKISEESMKAAISEPLMKEMMARTNALANVGLEYLALGRGTDSISGGEAQRIRLASQIGSELMGIVYILDEPSIGLHNRDTVKLVDTMKQLRDSGSSVIVVEHDENIIRDSDWVIDMGPGAGVEGGQVIFQGEIQKLLKAKTTTAQYLTGKKKISEKNKYRRGLGKNLDIIGAREHNLKDIDVRIPLGKFIAITGVSGSGKSTLVNDILAKALSKHFFRAKDVPGVHSKIKGLNNIDKVINIDQAPIGRTPRSNAATYTGVFSLIRELFAETEEARKRGYTPSLFSFNMKGGRCEVCQGEGTKKIEMHLLPDIYVRCEACQGTRYNLKALDIEYQGVNISEVLDMSVSYALKFFRKSPLIVEKFKTLENVGLGYLKLGQSATNLSGGEAQRIKLATELSRKSTGQTLYILDEPTIGLHFDDVKNLLKVLDALVDKGNTVLVVEHNLEVVRNADWVIDLGPEGGDKGGSVVYAGTPDKLAAVKKSWTGKFMK